MIEATVAFSTTITQASSDALITNLRAQVDHGVEKVVLDISTPGGEVKSGMGLYRALRSMDIELVTHNTNKVSSIGNIIFLAGDRRLAYPEATFMLHPVAYEFGNQRLSINDFSQLRTEAEGVRGDQELLRELDLGIARLRLEDQAVRAVLEERTNLSRTEIEVLNEGKPFDASYALKVGVIHEIVPAPSGGRPRK